MDRRRHTFGPNTVEAREASPECPLLSDIMVGIPSGVY
ncbi:unnamed protein product [Ectocarpus sp. CCAP 1310/34]|nr:unnamed protein product [Ectocarpus sp. CCAP 1310/34]